MHGELSVHILARVRPMPYPSNSSSTLHGWNGPILEAMTEERVRGVGERREEWPTLADAESGKVPYTVCGWRNDAA